MNREPLFCDFCAFPKVSKAYPIDEAGLQWYACAVCEGLIEHEDWDGLVDRCVSAHGRTGFLSEDAKKVVLAQVQGMVRDFRSFRLVPA